MNKLIIVLLCLVVVGCGKTEEQKHDEIMHAKAVRYLARSKEINEILSARAERAIEEKEKYIGKFTQLNKGHCSYWNQDVEPMKYVQISCWNWLDLVMDNPSKLTECILDKCESCTRDYPNLIYYEEKYSVMYGWAGPMGVNNACEY